MEGGGRERGIEGGRERESDFIYLSICVQKTSDIAFPSFPHVRADTLSGGVLNRSLSLSTPHLEGETELLAVRTTDILV